MSRFVQNLDSGHAAEERGRTVLSVGVILGTGGLFLLGLWAAAFLLVAFERGTDVAHARAEAGNLSAAFQDEVTKVLDQVSGAMELVAQRMRAEQGAFDIHEWARDIPLLSAATAQAAIIGPDGRMLSTTLEPRAQPIDVSDREYFRVHLDGAYRGLFISKPVLGRVSGQVSIQVTKRVDALDGRFLGVIVFSLSPAQLTTLHRLIDLGPRGMITLFGTDNIVRARFAADSPDGTARVGTSLISRPERANADERRGLIHIGESPVDHVVRVYSDRRIPGYPLFVGVGLNLNDVLAPANSHARLIVATAAAVTLLLCALLAALVGEVIRRAKALRRAAEAEALLRDAMDSISEGFVIYDSDDRLVICNEAYRHMYPASAPLMVPGVTFETLVRNSLTAGQYPDAAGREGEFLADFLRQHHEAVSEIETQTADGRWILVSERRMRNGGLAGVRVDITELKQIQAALRDSERRMRDFAEMASDWFWEQDAELRFTTGNLSSDCLAPDDDLFVGKLRWEANDTSKAPERWEEHKQVLFARKPFRDFRFHQVRPDGKLHHVSISGTPVYDDSGRFVGYRGSGRDITAQLEAEQEVEQAKERAEQAETLLRDAVDSISEGFVIFDHEDRFVMCNQGYRQIYADGAELLVPGQRFEDIVRHVVGKGSNIEACGREEEWIAKRLRNHREARDSMERRRANGGWYLSTDRRMKNGGIAGLRIDITALKQAQAALYESEARLDRAQEIAGIGSWELDIAKRQYIWSRQFYRLRGRSPDYQPTRESVADNIHPDDLPAMSLWIADLQAGHEREPMEIRVPHADGDLRIFRVEGRAVVDPDSVIRRIAGTVQDVTDRRLIERQLAQAQKMEAIGTLTGGMAHDFNNVLGVIIGNLELLKRLIRDDPAATDLCSEALDGAGRCTDLIRRLLAFARRQSLRPERTDVSALVGDVVRLLGRILGENIMLNLHLDTGARQVVVDRVQLKSALINLASNARDAMPKGGRLNITTSNAVLDASYTALHPDVSAGAYVCIEVSDTGTGIAPEIIGHIFEPFFTTKEPGKGTGLGLSMAFGFVAQSGGHLSVYSEPGLGTTFRLYLPSNTADDGIMAGPSDPGAVMGGDERVLVVEDNARLRQTTVRQLTELGYRVLEAEHAAAALAILSGECVDLLFTDLVMPGSMDGLDLAHHALSLRPGLNILLTSGFPGVRSADQRMDDCPFPLLTKPFRRDELARIVRGVLDVGSNYATNAEVRRFALPNGGRPINERTGEGQRL